MPISLIVLGAFAASAANDQAGTRSFQFLRIGVGARAVGMGDAFTAVATGAEGIEWNPAGIGQVNNPTLATNYLNYVSDINAGSITFVQPAGRRLTWGTSLRFFNVGDIPRTTVENPTGEGLGQFSSTDLALKGSASYRLSKKIFLGASAAVISGSIDKESALGTSVDFGLLVRNAWRNLRVGAAVRNLGSMSSAYLVGVDPLPTQVLFGTAWSFGRDLLLAGDYSWSVDRDPLYSLGAEWEVVTDFYMRTGYRTGLSDVQTDGGNADLTGLTFGLGLRRFREYSVDYAYASMGDLGGTHRFSFGWVFQ